MTNSFLSVLRNNLFPSRWKPEERAEAARAELVVKRLESLLGQPRDQKQQHLPPSPQQSTQKNNAA